MKRARVLLTVVMAGAACSGGPGRSADGGQDASSDAAKQDFASVDTVVQAQVGDTVAEAQVAADAPVPIVPDAPCSDANARDAASTETGSAVALFVSPAGTDDGPGTLDRPFRTLTKARDVIRALDAAHGPVTVYLRGGRHALSTTFVLEAADSGTPASPITYAAYPEETAVLSGGIAIQGWSVDAQGRWVANVAAGLRFRQLYVGDRHAQRARGAAPALVGSWGPTDVWPAPPPAGYVTTDVQLATWRNPADIELGYYNAWSHRICSFASVVSEQPGQLSLAMKQPCFFFGVRTGGDVIDLDPLQAPAYMENALELLDEPGEWYHDPGTSTLFYAPRPGESPDTTQVIVPVLERLLEVRGSLDTPVHDVAFRGLTFAHATYLRPSSEVGHIDIQANFTPDPDPAHTFWQEGKVAMVHNQALKSPAAVQVSAGQAIAFERCTFTQLGGAGLDIANGSQANRVVGSRFFELSGSGIQVGDVLEADHHPSDPRQVVKDNLIANNYLHDLGLDYEGSIAIFVGYTDGTVIQHNELADLPYSGVSVGWGWGDEDVGGGRPPTQPVLYTTPTIAANNRIEYNHIHHVMQRRLDGGGVYTLGEQPNTIIQGNYVHDSPLAEGIYLDEGSAWIEITRNVVRGASTAIALNNKFLARDQTCSVHDNYFDEAVPSLDATQIAHDAGLELAYRDLLGP